MKVFVVLFLAAAAHAASVVPATYESSVVRNDRTGNNFAYSITEKKAVGGAVVPEVVANPVEIQPVSLLVQGDQAAQRSLYQQQIQHQPLQVLVADSRNLQVQQVHQQLEQQLQQQVQQNYPVHVVADTRSAIQQVQQVPVVQSHVVSPLRRVQNQVLLPVQNQYIQPVSKIQQLDVPVTRIHSSYVTPVSDVQNLEIQNVKVTPLNLEQANVKTLNYGIVPATTYELQQQVLPVNYEVAQLQTVPVSNLKGINYGVYGINYGIRGLNYPYAYSYPYAASNGQVSVIQQN